ncbi:ROK family transcriptional regulator [Brevibacillus humidisoli]|uniref:ROK family transcriptional regulator n=1 Tax=Brevibacillus humidisoli TaxID=2895522 RepID=UPI001E53DEF3|nr:ROK family transcriptional regulator [Brevibacillus humidisoli]UFJ39611.1 ROK family transcriptional regulator [Brevibacillus humidisoli]
MADTIQIGSFQWMKSVNKSVILNLIRLHGPISRAEIAKMCKLTPPTVTNIVGELLESGIVIESTLGESSGGRKPILLRINTEAFCVIGVNAGAKTLRVIATLLDNTVVKETVSRLPSRPSAEEFLDTVKRAIRAVIDEVKLSQKPILGIGVGMHGLVNPENGVALFAPHPDLRDVPVKDVLEEEFQLPVEVDNDVRAQAMAESWFGQAQGVANFISMYVGTGIGAGIFLNHQLFHGMSHTAGEIGHTTVDIDGPPCCCGNRGCLEALADGSAIARRAREAIEQGKSTLLAEWGASEEITGNMVYEAAKQGDQVAIDLLAQTGRYLGVGVANVIHTLNPSLIILSGGVARAGEYVLEPLRKTVSARLMHKELENVKIVTSQLGKNSAAIGAATLVLQKFFAPSGISEV